MSPDDALPPVHCDPLPWYRLQGLDTALLGAPSLYLARNDDASIAFDAEGLPLLADDWLGSGTLRNSFYVAPWSELSRARNLGLVIEAQGTFRLRILLAAPGRSAAVLREKHLTLPQREVRAIELDSLGALPPGSRLFWHLDALGSGRLHQVSWCCRERPRADLRLAVLMRTWGRTADLQSQLRRFVEGARVDPYHAALLARCSFWVLDTSPGAAQDWAGAESLGLDLRVLHGPNLGGGGNASHLMLRFLEACEADACLTPSDVLLLDDDAVLSMESLARHLAACGLREKDHITTLPILQRSRPTVVWEDGGFWGRLNFQVQGEFGRRRNLAPHLLKHGLTLDGYEHLDDFDPLNTCEYATFIFFGVPYRALQRLGLPAAFFLRGDDIEYSLRAQGLGLPIVSNPNLAAWHEPGHSYPQEYMAILHAILINFQHSDSTVDDLVRWFERRFSEHGQLGDLAAMQLYLSILDALLDPDSTLLTPDFPRHYAQALPPLAAVRFQRLPESERERIERRAREQGAAVLPFLYPGHHPEGPLQAPRVVCNPGAQTYRELPACPTQERLALQQRAWAQLAALEARFDALRSFWCARLAHAGTVAFWRQVAQDHAAQTRLLLNTPYQPQTPAPHPRPAVEPNSSLAHVPVRELRRRIEQQLGELAHLRRQAQRSAPPASRLHRWLRHFWSGAMPGSAPHAARPGPPPIDFDPAQYLALNADVARTGMDPTQHYLRHGRSEGRRYRT